MKELYAALARAQGKFPPIIKNKTVRMKSKRTDSIITFKFADLDEIISKTRPAMAEEGLSVTQLIQPSNDSKDMVIDTVIAHASGESMTSKFPIPGVREFSDPKEMGAYISYIRRYALTAALGVAADDDLDDNGEGMDDERKPAKSQPRRRQEPEQPAAKNTDQPAEQKADGKKASAGEINWLKKKLETRADAAELLKKVGATSVDDITADQFAALKTAVLS